MEIKLRQEQESKFFQADLVIKAAIGDVWQLLTTTEGLAKWFKELKAEQLAVRRLLTFEADDIKEDMLVLNYEEDKFLKFIWAAGEVAFQLKADDHLTRVQFNEILPPEFPDSYQDLAGWYYKLQVLQAAAQGSSFEVTGEMVQAKAAEFQKLLQQAESKEAF